MLDQLSPEMSLSNPVPQPVDRRLKNELQICLKVIEHIRSIQNETGYGKVELDIKDGFVVYIGKTVRDHLT
jgi:hypothetical protein